MLRGARLALAASLVARAAPSATAGGAGPPHIQVASHGPGPTRARQNNSRAERVATIRESSGFQLTGRQTRADSDWTADIA